MAKKTAAQLDREIAEWQAARSGLSKHHTHLLSKRKPGGGLRAGHLTPAGWHGDPMVIEDRKLRLEALREQPAPRFPKDPGRSHATKKKLSTMEATAGFSVHTDHEDVINDNARERFGPDYGDATERAKRMKAGLVDAQGKITDRGWEQLNKDVRTLENNALAWLRKTFGRASDQGHDSYGDLIGGLSFDPRSSKHAHNIVMGKDERIDFSDASYGDFARSGAWKGVSTFGQDVLGGHITFFDIQPPEAFEIAEETADRRKRR
jgi:hypothetical protein